MFRVVLKSATEQSNYTSKLTTLSLNNSDFTTLYQRRKSIEEHLLHSLGRVLNWAAKNADIHQPLILIKKLNTDILLTSFTNINKEGSNKTLTHCRLWY